MDRQESDEAQTGGKIPIERLSKEDLVKKYRQAILIAQKAKESKVELMKHLSQHEKLVQTLEERLQKSEEEKAVEASLRAEIENKLINTIEAQKEASSPHKDFQREGNKSVQQESNKNENQQDYSVPNTSLLKESFESEIKKHCTENAKLLSGTKVSNDGFETLESEPLQVKTEFESVNGLKEEAKNLVAAKDCELTSVQEALSREQDLRSKLKYLEEEIRLKSEASLENEEKVKSLQHLLLCKDEDIKKQEECIAEMKLCWESVQKEMSEKQTLLDCSTSKLIVLECQVKDYQKKLDESSSDESVEKVTGENTCSKDTIAKMDEELCGKESTISELSKELLEMKENLDLFKQLSSESLARMNLLKSENSFLSEKITTLETESTELTCLTKDKVEEIKELEGVVSKLDILVKKLQSELSEKESDNKDKVARLVRELEDCKKIVQDQSHDDTVYRLSEKNAQLEQEVLRRGEEIREKEDSITYLKSELETMKNNLDQLKLLSTESASKLDTHASENATFLQRLSSLEAEKTRLIGLVDVHEEETRMQKKLVSDREIELEKLQNEVLEKEMLLENSGETIAQLNLQILTLSTNLQENKSYHDIKTLGEENVKLERNILQKDCKIPNNNDKIACFSLEISDLKNELQSLEDQKIEMINQIEEMRVKLEEKENEIGLYQTKVILTGQLEQELREQLSLTQVVLSDKEALIKELEHEVLKLKEAAAHESTNTEISSTFSLSRAEELSRMKDLEDSFEDKYTKLRVVAVKLKKRVTELTQTLELERSKTAAEKSDLQTKLGQLASNAKTVQTLQCEVDRLQDLLEEQKKVQQQLIKDLESAVKEAASRKFELASVQDELLRTTNEKKNLETSFFSLESTLPQTSALQNEIDKLSKELREKDCVLETCKEEKQILSDQLEKVCADAKSKSMLSLEMADMEKSVSELTRQLSSERDHLKITENELAQEHSSLLSLQDKLKNLEYKLDKKDIAIKELKEKLALAKGEKENFESKFKEKEAVADQFFTQLEKQRSLVEELNIQCSALAAKQAQTKENARHQIETLSRQVFQLEEQCSSLKESRKAVEDELASVRTDFENYKVRAQSVLRQSAKQEERVISSSTVHNAEELEVEVERLRVNVSNLKENLKLTTSQLQAALQEVNVEREEKIRATKQAQASKESCAQAIERQHAAEERFSVIREELKQAKLHSDMLVQCYKQQLEDLKTTHQKKVTSLSEQLEHLQASITNPILPPVESDQVPNVPSGPSPVTEWAIHLANAPNSDTDLAMRLSSLQREEGEGSESVDSFPSRRISVTTHERRHEMVPLDKLLSTPSYPEDDRDVARANSSDLNVDILQSKLSACESRAAHLTALLSEAESDAARLSQLNAVLKEEIRRQQRCEERTQHAQNLEYLKNIVVKFITLQNGDERQRLVPVLNTILKLSPDEANLISSVAKGASQTSSAARGWGSYLPLPGWTGS